MKFLLLDPHELIVESLAIPELELAVYASFGLKFFEALIRIVYPHVVVIFGGDRLTQTSRDYVDQIQAEKAFSSTRVVYLGKDLAEDEKIFLYEKNVEIIESAIHSQDKVARLVKALGQKYDIPRRPMDDYIKVLPDKLTVRIDNREISLIKKEFILFQLLYHNPNKLISRKEIFDFVWKDATTKSDRTIDVHMSRLRKKLGLKIFSVRNHGFRLEP